VGASSFVRRSAFARSAGWLARERQGAFLCVCFFWKHLHAADALLLPLITISDYRIALYEYLKNRMQAVAPNLVVMVGELVGARLIAHAGSLLSLAKYPASTVQILGAEKALFRALKTKHATPKYGLIYHASLVGQAAPKNKGKISRVLAAKTALAIRMDCMGDTDHATIGLDNRVKVELRLQALEGGKITKISGQSKSIASSAKYQMKPVATYNEGSDVVSVASSTGLALRAEAGAERKKKKRKPDVVAAPSTVATPAAAPAAASAPAPASRATSSSASTTDTSVHKKKKKKSSLRD